MKHRATIQTVLAFFLLMVFAIGITPKTYLHECLADHGTLSSWHADKELTLDKSGFDCDCDEMVVSIPFTGATPGLQCSIFKFDQAFNSLPYQFIFSTIHAVKDLRGPPANS